MLYTTNFVNGIYIFRSISFVNEGNSVTSCNSNGVHTKTEMLTSNPQKNHQKLKEERTAYIHTHIESATTYIVYSKSSRMETTDRERETEREEKRKYWLIFSTRRLSYSVAKISVLQNISMLSEILKTMQPY